MRGKVVEFSCPDGMKLDGARKAKCLAKDGKKWNKEPPTCVPKDNKQGTWFYIHISVIVLKGIFDTKKVTFSCQTFKLNSCDVNTKKAY